MEAWIMANAEWKAYGDKNPLEHGGIWVLSDEEKNGEAFKGCYYIVKYNPDTFHITECWVNVNDDWIEKKEVMDYCGMSQETYDEIQYAINCTDYYNYMEFQGTLTTVRNLDEAIEELRKHEISF